MSLVLANLAEETDAYEVVASKNAGRPPVVYTCEHASNALPESWNWHPEDGWITTTHWAWDIGAALVTRRLVQRCGGVGVLAKFSRLLIDANRHQSAEGLFRTEAEGRILTLNQHLSEGERQRRVEEYYLPYHEAVDRCIRATPDAPVIAIHSFTPVYEGEQRGMELGVLFDHSDDLAHAIATALRDQGFVVAMNEPYSGKNGMMYSAYRHAHDHGREALEFEIRQDLLQSPEACEAIADRIYGALAQAGLGGT